MTDDAEDDSVPTAERDPSPADHEWPVLESAVEYETGWYTGGYDLVELPDGRTKRYYWAELPPAVVVVAVVDDPAGLGLPAPDSDAPAGRRRHGRTVSAADRRTLSRTARWHRRGRRALRRRGARELEEEVGLVPESVDLLEDFWCSTGVLRHPRGIVWAEGFSRGERKLDGSEFLDIVTVPVEEALDVARRDPANDATIEGLLLARADGYL